MFLMLSFVPNDERVGDVVPSGFNFYYTKDSFNRKGNYGEQVLKNDSWFWVQFDNISWKRPFLPLFLANEGE